LCDEPLQGIDPKGQHGFKTELQRLRGEGCAVLVSTHPLDTAERLCDRILIMDRGRKVNEGSLDFLRAEARMQESTLEEVLLRLTSDTAR
jgi:ABC-2 type transport system ATP-binding protein